MSTAISIPHKATTIKIFNRLDTFSEINSEAGAVINNFHPEYLIADRAEICFTPFILETCTADFFDSRASFKNIEKSVLSEFNISEKKFLYKISGLRLPKIIPEGLIR